MFHPLESRRFLSAVLLNNVITVTGTDSADHVYISFSPHSVYSYSAGITINGQDASFEFSTGQPFPSLIVNALGGDDSIYVAGYPFASIQINGGAGNDSLRTDSAASILGGDGNDTLLGGDYDDTLSGGNGNDWVVGNGGDDRIAGDVGDDSLSAGPGDDSLLGGDGNDTAEGALGNDTMSGGNGNDSLVGREGDDNITGDAGNDFLSGGIDNDLLNGSDGDDILVGNQGNDTLDGKAGNDFLTGNEGNDLLRGSDGDDNAYGNEDNDTLDAGASSDGIDDYNGGPGTDTIDYSARADLFGINVELDDFPNDGVPAISIFATSVPGEQDNVHSDFEVVLLGSGWDHASNPNPTKPVRIEGGPGDDDLFGSGTLLGGAGDDYLKGSQDSDDELWGGDGIDTASYTDLGRPENHFLSIDNFPNDGIAGEHDNIRDDCENIHSGSGDDLIYGSAKDNSIGSGSGNDTIFGLAGNDTLSGGLLGDHSEFNGGRGHDTFESGGPTTFRGGRGTDTVDYSLSLASVYVSLDNLTGDGADGRDNVLSDVENIRGGHSHDTLIGNSSNNVLSGNGGDDSIYAGGGNDTLQGDSGSDYLYGEAGHDLLDPGFDSLFDYLDGGRGADTLLTSHYDQIQDYLRRIESTQI